MVGVGGGGSEGGTPGNAIVIITYLPITNLSKFRLGLVLNLSGGSRTEQNRTDMFIWSLYKDSTSTISK